MTHYDICTQVHHSEWRAYIGEYPELAGFQIVTLHNRLFGQLCGGTMERDATRIPSELRGWPKPDPKKPLFDTCPEAVADHGSPARLPLPSHIRSLTGSSMAFAAGVRE